MTEAQCSNNGFGTVNHMPPHLGIVGADEHADDLKHAFNVDPLLVRPRIVVSILGQVEEGRNLGEHAGRVRESAG